MNTKPINVKQVFMHMGAHFDELLAYVLLQLYGEEQFPGIRQAELRFVEKDVAGSDEEYDREGILRIGVGGGRFDEHRNDKEDRLADECSSTLVAKYLGISERPELLRLLDEACYFDTNAGCQPTQLPALVQAGYRLISWDQYKIVGWLMPIVEAVIKMERFHFAPVPGEKSLLQIWKGMADQEPYKSNERIRSFLFSQIHASTHNKERSVLELAHVVEAMSRWPMSEEAIRDQLEFPLMAIFGDQEKFLAEVERLKQAKPIYIKAYLDGMWRSIRLLACQSDSEYAHKAALYLEPEIVLVRNSKGNFQIYIDVHVKDLSLSNVVRMIRWLELPKDKKMAVKWQDLGCGGDHPDVENIYYHRTAEAVYNGTTTHKARPSVIGTPALIDALKCGFCREGVKTWCNERGIRMDGSNVRQEAAKVA